ncbi:hypothetical protein JNUCC64_03840 [Streptomyces sp. JNUCC 64]
MDPVLVGAVAAVVISVVSAVAKTLRGRQMAKVELARIADEGLTERVRVSGSRGSLQETGRGRTVWAASPTIDTGGDRGETRGRH